MVEKDQTLCVLVFSFLQTIHLRLESMPISIKALFSFFTICLTLLDNSVQLLNACKYSYIYCTSAVV